MISILLSILLLGGGVEKAATNKKELSANRISEAPRIDGVLDEAHWLNLEESVFTQSRPQNGSLSAFKTSVSVVYTDHALYIGARMYDAEPDKIQKEFGLRDDFNRNADWFGILLDPYQSGMNAFTFLVSAAGVQGDYLLNVDNFDGSWDAVWNSAVKIDEEGWTVEIEIPYYSIRFPKQEVQTWGVNFYRQVKRLQEESFWNPVDNSIRGIANQAGVLNGIEQVQPPLRLSFLPYMTSIYNHDGNADKGEYKIAGGMDLKYGINESFTLDVSLIPDFSQVQSDNLVLNLSAFEVQFNENRPFFTEGTELFNKSNLFYSRRVGQSFGSVSYDRNTEQLISRPATAPLINAMKLSGRNPNGLGLGFFNAITNATYATVENIESGDRRSVEVDPLTNFNVIVVDKNLANNSNINFINTNVTRFGDAGDANVSGLNIALNDKTNTFGLRAFGALSNIMHTNEGGRDYDLGYSYQIELAKISGTVQYGAVRLVESDNYNINDFGFLRAPNEITHRAYVSYNIFKPVWKLNSLRASAAMRHEQLYAPQKFAMFASAVSLNTQFTNFWDMGMRLGISPVTGYDFFEPREQGWYFLQLPSGDFNAFLGTDNRKAFKVDVFKGGWRRPDWDQQWNWHGTFMRYRVNDKLSFTLNVSRERGENSRGYVRKIYDDNQNLDEIIFGERDIITYNNVMGAKYTFNNKMGLDLRVRHYWSAVKYNSFYKLGEDGDMHATSYKGIHEDGGTIHDTNFNAFNVDMVYFMQIAPGSFINFVWKDSILTADQHTAGSYTGNFDRMLKSPQINSVSLRLTYFIDYLSVKKSISKA